MVAQHPDDLGLAVLAQAADMGKQPPGVGAEVAEAPVVEDVAQQDQALEAPLLQHRQQIARPGGRQPEMQIGDDEGVDLGNGEWTGLWRCGSRAPAIAALLPRGYAAPDG